MSQAAGNDGQAVPEGEPEHVSVHTEASSFTPQQASEQAVPGVGPIPEAVPIIQPQITANFINFLQQMAGAYVPPPSPPPPPVAVVTIEKLPKNGAEEFLGDQIADPMIAKRWFERTIRVLGNLRVPQEQRGDLAVALLQDSAYDWWKRVGADVPEPVQWATFDRLFHEEYIPEHFVEAKREEFLKFTQGELTLPEYRQKFDELAGFGQDLVPTVEKRCQRFVEGLRPDLSTHLINSPRSDINKLYKNALDLNAALIRKAKFEQAQGVSAAPSRPPPPQKAGTSSKRSFVAPSSSHQSKKVKSAQLSRPRRAFPKRLSEESGGGIPAAPAASAPAAQPAQSQKSAAASSQPKRQASGAQGGKAPARTYAMRGRTEQPAHDVIMGMFTLFDTSIIALIDPGSTLSYVCMPMPVMPNLPRENLDNPVIVSNPLGHSLRLTHVYHDCPLVVQGKIFPASLIELPHREFDVILGMDWLTANQAVVDCGAHTVRLRAEDGSDVLIHGELLPKAPEFISYIHARRLIRKKCEAFLCTVRDTRQEAPSRGDIPTPTLQQQIASAQSSDDFCIQTVELVSRGEKPDFAVQDGILYYRERMVVPAGEIHDVFHVSMLRRYRSDPSHVIPADTVTLDDNLTYEEEPVEILAREVCQLRNKTIPLVKVLWRSHTVEEATWETEESMRTRYPHLFSD
ncbi:unnamed protein product [Cuscuta campestris]|uniref:Retrotransposon gag domain-containing protein n=1 Tax=Cuscuta campestris TaxID=132261 RepID=A0A484LAL4_9ASTE|nr:unnamed protein product [Cuscuta campestris]